jgi:hypothetical protein
MHFGTACRKDAGDGTKVRATVDGDVAGAEGVERGRVHHAGEFGPSGAEPVGEVSEPAF